MGTPRPAVAYAPGATGSRAWLTDGVPSAASPPHRVICAMSALMTAVSHSADQWATSHMQ
jgi:hypothetical protein